DKITLVALPPRRSLITLVTSSPEIEEPDPESPVSTSSMEGLLVGLLYPKDTCRLDCRIPHRRSPPSGFRVAAVTGTDNLVATALISCLNNAGLEHCPAYSPECIQSSPRGEN
ncbi:hypothetical protein CCH79_00017341, partial [Gambusia affinis]